MTRHGAAYVAGAVRARALGRRCVGPAAARVLATNPGLGPAVAALISTPYGHDVRPGQSLVQVQDAVAGTLLWHLRVLAGWLPPGGVEPLRALAGWFEIRNVEQHFRQLERRPAPPAYALGALASAWPRLAQTTTLDGLRAALAASAWGDPGAATARAVAVSMRLAWAQRVAAIPGAEPWAAAAAALVVAREHWLVGRPVEPPAAGRAATLIAAVSTADGTFADFVSGLPARAAWVFDGIEDPATLWRAEARWWRRFERDGQAMLHGAAFDDRTVLGAAVVLAVDAWRVRAAVACAADGGNVAPFDTVAEA